MRATIIKADKRDALASLLADFNIVALARKRQKKKQKGIGRLKARHRVQAQILLGAISAK